MNFLFWNKTEYQLYKKTPFPWKSEKPMKNVFHQWDSYEWAEFFRSDTAFHFRVDELRYYNNSSTTHITKPTDSLCWKKKIEGKAKVCHIVSTILHLCNRDKEESVLKLRDKAKLEKNGNEPSWITHFSAQPKNSSFFVSAAHLVFDFFPSQLSSFVWFVCPVP